MRRFLALILTVLMLTASVVPALAAEDSTVADSIAVFNDGVLRAAYADKEIKMNGTPSESGWEGEIVLSSIQ